MAQPAAAPAPASLIAHAGHGHLVGARIKAATAPAVAVGVTQAIRLQGLEHLTAHIVVHCCFLFLFLLSWLARMGLLWRARH